jgi:hypothetical protein
MIHTAQSAFEAAHWERANRRQARIERLENGITELSAHIYAATYRLLELIRELTLYEDDDGSFVVHGRLTPEQGALVKKALEAGMNEDFKEQKNVPAGTSDKINPRPQWGPSRRADALVRIAEAYLSNKAKQSNGGDRYLVHVHTDVATLKADGTGAEAEIEDCGHVCAETSRRLSCDAGVVHWLEHADGEPLSVGRKTRTIPPAIRRALKRRDGGCRFPGCTCTRFVDAHHIRHWADGGETSMDNLTLLCRHHHRLVHEGGFSVVMDADGQVRFTNPDGQVMSDSGDKRSRGNVIALCTVHAASGIHITPETTQTLWHGEQMDDQLAVEGLLYRE